MIFGINGTPIPVKLPYAAPIQSACGIKFPAVLAYSVAARETIIGERDGLWPDATTVISKDGGHGLFQLTDSFPDDWRNPKVNAEYALRNWLIPDMLWWRYKILGMTGDDLVRCIAASFNAGRERAWIGHVSGDVDKFTTNGYGQGVLEIFRAIIKTGELPT